MISNSFINIATQDVFQARQFFTTLGLSINEQFSDPNGICVIVNDTTFLMVMSPTKFKGFTKKELPDLTKVTAVILSFQLNSKEAVDQLLANVLKAGGTEIGKAEDNEYMYYRSFRDLDGHHFEVFFFKV